MTDPTVDVLNGSACAFEAAGFHDATVHSVTLDWTAAEVSVALTLPGGDPAILTFHSVTSAALHRHLPWGPSSAINEAKTLSIGEFEIEMQSGDRLHFVAESWSIRISELAGRA